MIRVFFGMTAVLFLISSDFAKDVPAIRNRRVHVLRDELLNTPGPPLVAGARELYRILHGRARAAR